MPGWLVDDSWAQVLRIALPLLDGARPAGMRMGAPCRPRCDPGRRRGRALGRRAPAAGPGHVDGAVRLRAGGVGLDLEERRPRPRRGRTCSTILQQNVQQDSKGGPVGKPGPKAPAAARTQTPAARRLERHLSRAAPCSGPRTHQYRLASHCRGDGPRRVVGPAPPRGG